MSSKVKSAAHARISCIGPHNHFTDLPFTNL